jgi:hypothetical protein
MKTFSRLGVFILIVVGIGAYLQTGIGLFEQVKASGLKLQMGRFDQALFEHYQTKRKFPKDFTVFSRKAFAQSTQEDPAKDPWGEYYRFEAHKKGYVLASSGGDQTWNSDDDLMMIREGDRLSFKFEKSSLKSSSGGESFAVEMSDDPLLRSIEDLMVKSAQEQIVLDEDTLNQWMETILEVSWNE